MSDWLIIAVISGTTIGAYFVGMLHGYDMAERNHRQS
jgi:hypothetical protein